ncbi:RnfH family protein [Halorhodospira halochloris]|uniref:RnfH family protein n=1 Tax=Halorhodospira halochloris TaxID=1052 RepID=UPI001EE8AC34|nr:RnfH family protein [Halorhodospira halochloris]MCG5530511.1 RnfH family protein [Halorhodospira halochloris]
MHEQSTIRVSVAYVEHGEHFWREFSLPAGSTALDAVTHSGVQQRFPAADPQQLKLGIFGKPVKPDRELEEGDRVELYRPITADPESVPRRDREEQNQS